MPIGFRLEKNSIFKLKRLYELELNLDILIHCFLRKILGSAFVCLFVFDVSVERVVLDCRKVQIKTFSLSVKGRL